MYGDIKLTELIKKKTSLTNKTNKTIRRLRISVIAP